MAEVIAPVQNKVGALVATPSLRNIYGQWRPKISFDEILAKKHVVIVNLAKGEIGEQPANMIGSFIVAGLQSAAMKRSTLLPCITDALSLYATTVCCGASSWVLRIIANMLLS